MRLMAGGVDRRVKPYPFPVNSHSTVFPELLAKRRRPLQRLRRSLACILRAVPGYLRVHVHANDNLEDNSVRFAAEEFGIQMHDQQILRSWA